MKNATGKMINNLAAYRSFWIANLILIQCTDGTILSYTDFQNDINFSSILFSSRGPKVQFSGFSQKIGTEVDEAHLVLSSIGTNLVESVAVLEFIGQGGFDGAEILVFRCMKPNPNDGSTGRPLILQTGGDEPPVAVFRGFVADITKLTRTSCDLSIKSRKELLNIPFPYATYQQSCRWALYSPGCTLSAAGHTVSGAIVGSSGVPLLFKTNLTNPDGYFDEGVIKFLTGPNVGISRTVRTHLHSSGEILLFYPLPKPPTAGDTFSILPGCDKQAQTCNIKFSNITNFGGFLYIPVPEAGI